MDAGVEEEVKLTGAGGEMSDMFALSSGHTGLKPSLDLLGQEKGPYSSVPLLNGSIAQLHSVAFAITSRSVTPA